MQVSPRKQSPRAPSIALEQALERALRVYEQERLHTAPVDAVAQALGFSNANNGSAAKAVASLRYFGLLERPKEGFLAVSKAVEAYKYAFGVEIQKQIVLEFLKTPPLYQALLEKYSAGLPSTATLKYELIQKGFLPQAVDAVLSAFIQSVSFARYFETSTDIPVEGSPFLTTKEVHASADESSQKAPVITQGLSSASIGELDQIPIRLSGSRKAWLSIPTPFYESDKERIKAQVDVLFADSDMRPRQGA
jgi:hypothetical protein